MKTLTESELEGCNPTTNGNVSRAFCPFHGGDKQRSLRVKHDSGHFRCYQCDAWGYMDWARIQYNASKGVDNNSYVRKNSSAEEMTRRLLRRQKTMETAYKPREMYKEFLPVHDKPHLSGAHHFHLWARASHYLLDRGISEDDQKHYNIHYCVTGRYTGRIIVPVVQDGETWGWVGRSIGDAKPKYLNSTRTNFSDLLFNVDNVQDMVVICEGVFDAMVVGRNAVATFGKDVTPAQCNRLSKFSTKIVMFDSDAKRPAINLAKRIGAFVVLIYGNDDPASLGREKCQELLRNGALSPSHPDVLRQLI